MEICKWLVKRETAIPGAGVTVKRCTKHDMRWQALICISPAATLYLYNHSEPRSIEREGERASERATERQTERERERGRERERERERGSKSGRERERDRDTTKKHMARRGTPDNNRERERERDIYIDRRKPGSKRCRCIELDTATQCFQKILMKDLKQLIKP